MIVSREAVLIEGPIGSGVRAVARATAELAGIPLYVPRHTPLTEKGNRTMQLDTYSRALPTGTPAVSARAHWYEWIYGGIFRSSPVLSKSQVMALDQRCLLIVVLLAPVRVVSERAPAALAPFTSQIQRGYARLAEQARRNSGLTVSVLPSPHNFLAPEYGVAELSRVITELIQP